MNNYQYHGESGWIKQPNRIVKTFPSGLCMIQQDYIRRKDRVDYFTFKEGDPISEADSAPCIDRAYIFPTPDYQDTGDGFIKCTLTAYGRVNINGQITKEIAAGYFSFDYNVAEPDKSASSVVEAPAFVYGLIPRYVQKFVSSSDLIGQGILSLQGLELETPAGVIGSNGTAVVPYGLWEASMRQLGIEIPSSVNVEYNGENYKIFHTVFNSESLGFSFLLGDFSGGIANRRTTSNIERIDSVNFGYFTEYTIVYNLGFRVKFQ